MTRSWQPDEHDDRGATPGRCDQPQAAPVVHPGGARRTSLRPRAAVPQLQPRAAERGLAGGRYLPAPVRADIVEAALLFHDAGYRLDPAAHGCRTREEVAAQLADADLAEQGWDQASRAAVIDAILATHRDAGPSTLEARIVREADLASMASDYPEFARDSDNLRAEAALLGAEPVTDAEWAQQVSAVIGWYLEHEPAHGSDHEGRRIATEGSRFHERTAANVRRYVAQLTGS